jgi:hypothetical protein
MQRMLLLDEVSDVEEAFFFDLLLDVVSDAEDASVGCSI